MSQIRRRKLLFATGALLVIPVAAIAQHPGKISRIGFLGLRSRASDYAAFTQGMRELGYVDGKNLVIEWRLADGQFDRLPGMAAELVRMKVEIIVTQSTPAVGAAKQATSAIPIVIASSADPVEAGFVASLARPGGNITGLSLSNVELTPKQLEMLIAMVPKLSRVAVLTNRDDGAHVVTLKNLVAAAQKIGVRVLPVEARTPEEIERAFATMKKEQAQAVFVLISPFFATHRQRIADLAVAHGLPSVVGLREYVTAGALLSYGTNIGDLYRRAATYVDKILKGAKPGELPIEQPTTFSLVINRKTAKTLGLTIPRELLLRADEMID